MATKEHGAVTYADRYPIDAAGRGVHSIEGFTSVADETARDAVTQVASDRGRVVYQAAGMYPGWYLADGAGGWCYLGGVVMNEIYNMNGKQMLWGGEIEIEDGMTGTDTIKSDWVALPPECSSVYIEALWDGNPTGTFFVEAANQKSTDLELSDLTDPDGTSYTGDLDAEDLENEDLGISGINISGIGFPQIRLGYTNSSGTGTLRARIAAKKGV